MSARGGLQVLTEQPAGWLIAAAHKSIQKLVAERLAPLRVSAQQFWIVLLLSEGALDSVQEIGRRIGVDKPAASRLADKLVARRWIRYQRSHEDRRRVAVELTAAGRKAAARFARLAAAINAEVERGLTPEERRTAAALLRRIIANVDAATR